jgi:hypothetical protein
VTGELLLPLHLEHCSQGGRFCSLLAPPRRRSATYRRHVQLDSVKLQRSTSTPFHFACRLAHRAPETDEVRRTVHVRTSKHGRLGPGGIEQGRLFTAGPSRARETGSYLAYPAAWTFCSTAASVSSEGQPAVMQPSKKVPSDELLLSPPMPRMMPLSFCQVQLPLGPS